MSKRSPEEIIKAVERYKRGETSQKAEARILRISLQTFQDWVRKYETFGGSYFQKKQRQQYSLELRLAAVMRSLLRMDIICLGPLTAARMRWMAYSMFPSCAVRSQQERRLQLPAFRWEMMLVAVLPQAITAARC